MLPAFGSVATHFAALTFGLARSIAASLPDVASALAPFHALRLRVASGGLDQRPECAEHHNQGTHTYTVLHVHALAPVRKPRETASPISIISRF